MMDKYGSLINAMECYELIAISDKVYGPYTRPSDGRKIVIIKDELGNSRTVSYPKYLVEQHLGRQLDPNEHTIDHWDSNKDNNNLDNLRIMPRSEHSSGDTRRVKLVKFNCALCGKEFERSPRLVRDKAKKNRSGPFCGRACAGKYSRKRQLNLIDKMDVQPVIDSEYYKQKYVVEALANVFAIKYGCQV